MEMETGGGNEDGRKFSQEVHVGGIDSHFFFCLSDRRVLKVLFLLLQSPG
jgi:hypothetical protein